MGGGSSGGSDPGGFGTTGNPSGGAGLFSPALGYGLGQGFQSLGAGIAAGAPTSTGGASFPISGIPPYQQQQYMSAVPPQQQDFQLLMDDLTQRIKAQLSQQPGMDTFSSMGGGGFSF